MFSLVHQFGENRAVSCSQHSLRHLCPTCRRISPTELLAKYLKCQRIYILMESSSPTPFFGRLETKPSYYTIIIKHGLPWWLTWQRICLQCGRPGFNPWVGRIPWRREQLPTSVFWPGEFHGLFHGITKSWTRLSDFHFQSSSQFQFFTYLYNYLTNNIHLPYEAVSAPRAGTTSFLLVTTPNSWPSTWSIIEYAKITH